jgi:hypothetical protein
MSRSSAFSALLVVAGFAGVLAPVSLTGSGGPGPAVAECATCCAQPGSTCVVCSTEKCVAYTGYYEGKTGPGGCDLDQT